jgi:hypothetical protein
VQCEAHVRFVNVHPERVGFQFENVIFTLYGMFDDCVTLMVRRQHGISHRIMASAANPTPCQTSTPYLPMPAGRYLMLMRSRSRACELRLTSHFVLLDEAPLEIAEVTQHQHTTPIVELEQLDAESSQINCCGGGR